MERNKIRFKNLLLVIGLLLSATFNSFAQTEDAELEEEYVEEQRFFNDINEDRFKSNLNDLEESERIDYSNARSLKGRNNFNIFGNESETYQFKENEVQNNSTKENIIIGLDGGNWQQAPNVTPNSSNPNLPSVKNPFGSNPGVKAPRNMDAVPDNGDDPNDVPLDGGVSILGFAALAYGVGRFKGKNKNSSKQ